MRVLVTGATGQVGSYLCEQLVASGHEVVGCGSPGSDRPLPAGVHRARGACTLHGLDALLGDNGALDAVAHLGAPTHIPGSWEDPQGTFEAIASFTAALAYAVAKKHPGVRLVHTSSSNVFGRVPSDRPLDESTPIAPASPYGVAKAGAQLAVANAREGFGARCSNVVFFQALSPRAAPTLVLRKITRGLAAVKRGEARAVKLGTLAVVRDVCHATDFARAVALLLGDAPAGDYVCASGRGRSIAEMASVACAAAGLDPREVIEEDREYARPSDIPWLVGDARKLRALGWAPQVAFEDLVAECVAFDAA